MSIKWIYDRTKYTSMFQTDVIVLSDGQTVVEWDGQGYIIGTNMIDVYRNGVYQQKDSYIELTENSIQFPEGYLSQDDVISIRYVVGDISLGNIRVCTNYSQLVNTHNPIVNEVAIVTSTKNMYIYTEFGWKEFMIPFTTQNVGTTFLYEKQSIISTAERTYTLQNISYPMGQNAMLVFIDGHKIEPSDYIEVDNRTITFNQDLLVGSQEIEFIVANSDSWEDSNNHTAEYQYSNGNIITEVVKVGVITTKTTNYSYNQDGNVVTEVIIKGGKTITRTFEYNGENVSKITTTIS